MFQKEIDVKKIFFVASTIECFRRQTAGTFRLGDFHRKFYYYKL